MSRLTHLHNPARIAIIGASGGLGHAFVARLANDDEVDHVYAFARSKTPFPESNVTSHELDYAAPETIEACAAMVKAEGPLDLVVVATGILHRGSDVQPEKTMGEIESRKLAEVLAINTIGPALVARYFLPLMRPESRTVFAALSARVGSIEDNRLGGWLAYRSSKAALNMVIKTLSVEQSRKRPQSLVVALHPGTVNTDLSQPFTRSVADDKLFSPADAADKLLAVIDKLPSDSSGGFFAWDGSRIPY